MSKMKLDLFMKLFISSFSVIIFISLSACNKQTEQVQTLETKKEVLSDSLKKTGFILGIIKDDNREFLMVDTVQVIKNNDTDYSAKQDQKKESLDAQSIVLNGFTIINSKKDSTKLLIDKNTEIVFQTFSFDSTGNFKFNEKLNYETFMNLLSSKDFDRFRNIPFKFVIKNDTSISIKEIYIP